MRRLLLAAAIGLLLSAGTVRAGTTQDGIAAYNRGDYAEALKLFRLGAAQSDAKAQGFLGIMYQDGKGVPQNYAEAIKWYLLAAPQGDVNAEFQLGSIYMSGAGVPKNVAEGVKWYRLAAAQGDATAAFSLGVMYSIGQRVPRNYDEAFKLIRLAVVHGNNAAQLALGSMYEKGEGVRRDYVHAYMYYNLAVPTDSAESKWKAEDIEPLAAKMTPQQIAQAKGMAQVCQQRNYSDCDSIQTGSDTTAPKANNLSWSGSNTSNTRPLTVNGPWELNWSATGSFFSIIIRSEDGDTVGVGANQAGSGDGSSFQPKGGRYFLAVSAIGPWRIWITPP